MKKYEDNPFEKMTDFSAKKKELNKNKIVVTVKKNIIFLIF